MSATDWIYWPDNPPPKNTKVTACWSITDTPIEVTTCKRGCCVYFAGHSMVLPNWWKPVAAASDGE